ncbi:MAG: hypothetical protein ACK4PI_06305 [Tepidisphaerales bacterium]
MRPPTPTSPIPLVSPAGHPDAWHDVRSPGGYEWWYFDAEDAATDTQLVAILLDGFVFHPGYLRRHFRYLRRPTRHPPATARDYPCAYFILYESGRVTAQFMTQYPPGSLQASRDGPDVRLGPNRFHLDGDDLVLSLAGTPWSLTPRGPVTHRDQRLTVSWRLTPVTRHPAHERPFLSRAMTGADHHWVLAAPHCRFTATVRLAAPRGDRLWQLAGRGYHDHNYGTGPLGPGLHRWIWGRALFDDACYTFHYAVPRDARLPPEPHVLRITPDAGVADVSPAPDAVRGRFDRHSALALAYPASLDLSVMRLAEPRVVDNTPFYLRLTYTAECEGRRGTAFCEVAYPHRLRWPVLGRMIEMSFDQRPSVV